MQFNYYMPKVMNRVGFKPTTPSHGDALDHCATYNATYNLSIGFAVLIAKIV